MMITKRKIKNSIKGFIVGDCLGVPFEFRVKGTFYCKKMEGYGTHNQPKGTWSDDTSLMLSLLDSSGIEENKQNLKDWYYQGKYCCDDRLFDIGNATKRAILNEFKNIDPQNEGNGSLLRVWPLAYTQTTKKELTEYINYTNYNENSFNYCWFFIYFIRLLLLGKSKEEALNIAEKETGIIIDRRNFSNGGWIKDSVESSINVFLSTSTFKQAVLKSVNLGNDSDSCAALTGALAGLFYGKVSFAKDIRNISKIEGVINNFINSHYKIT